MMKIENSSCFNYCTSWGGDDTHLHEPLFHHIFQTKKLVDGLKKAGVNDQ